jgi:hypothetical protein
VSRGVSLRRRLIASIALAVGVANVIGAQSEGAKTTTGTTPPDAIAEARKEFETIKSVRDAALLPNGRMPKVGVPELSLPPTASPVVTPKAKPNPREAKSSTWLLDAMAKESNSSSSRTPESRARERSNRPGSRERGWSEFDRDPREMADDGRQAARGDREEREDREQASAPVNPLNAYLGEWMTPQDYALLKPGLTSASVPGMAGGVAALPGTLGATIPEGGLKDLSFGSPVAPANAFPQAPRENPYLQSLKPEMPLAGAINRGRSIETTPVTVAPRQKPTIAPTPPVAPPQSKIPEFAKPPTDDRYFKQV